MDVDQVVLLLNNAQQPSEVNVTDLENLLHSVDGLLLKDVLSDLIHRIPSALNDIHEFLSNGGSESEHQENKHQGSTAPQTPTQAEKQPLRFGRAFSTSAVPKHSTDKSQHRITSMGPNSYNVLSASDAVRRSIGTPSKSPSKRARFLEGHELIPCSWKPRETCDMCNKEMKNRLFSKQLRVFFAASVASSVTGNVLVTYPNVELLEHHYDPQSLYS
eukprot:gene4818-114_t